MPVQMIELKEVMMVEASDEALESAVSIAPRINSVYIGYTNGNGMCCLS